MSIPQPQLKLYKHSRSGPIDILSALPELPLIREGRITLALPSVLSVVRQQKVLWLWLNPRSTVIFDSTFVTCTTWEKNTFSFPIEDASYVIQTAAGGTIHLEILLPPSTVPSVPLQKRPWILSFACHMMLVLAAALSLMDRSWLVENSGTSDNQAIPSPAEESLVAALPNRPDRPAFKGRSLWYFLEGGPQREAATRINSLLSSELANAGNAVSPSMGGGSGSGLSSLVNFSIQGRGVETGDLAKVAGTKIALTPEVSAADRNRAEAELRAKMDQVQRQFVGLYDRSLKKDPGFNTRIVLTARVNDSGSFENLRALPNGHSAGQQNLAQELAQAIASAIKGMNVPRALSGRTVRREFVFWR